MQELATSYHRQGVALNDVTDIFFMRYRLPLWNGVMMNNIFGAVRGYPLVNGPKYAFSKGYRTRAGDRIHFELMLRINPALCAMQLLKFAWPHLIAITRLNPVSPWPHPPTLLPFPPSAQYPLRAPR